LVTQAIRCPIPLGYDLLAKTWNADAANVLPHRFATVSLVTSQSQHPEIITAGDPISMGDFFVNAEDCSITTTNTINAEIQALACYVAMGTVHSRQKHDADH
jgi:hypothetical protein